MGLTNKQWLAIVMVVLGVMTASTAQMTDIFGPALAKHLASAAAMLNTILAGITAVISSQGSLVKDVQAMPGVEKITVNAQANQVLAAVAVDPSNLKVEAKQGAEAAVANTAKNG